ncbi:unnamed protein product [Pylaiella littoralis]
MPRRNGLAGVALVLALGNGADAFTTFRGSLGGRNTGGSANPSSSSSACRTRPETGNRILDCLAAAVQQYSSTYFHRAIPTAKVGSRTWVSITSLAMAAGMEGGGGSSAGLGRGEFLSSVAASAGLGLAAAAASPGAAGAAVNFETERYGDKELKIATVNKLRQQIRNSLLEEPKLAPEMLKLAIVDALGFDASTQTGGPDGSVTLELDREASKGLKDAVDNALKIKKNLQRTNEMTLADVISMGGAEAIHACGGPPMLVQLGRYDEKKQPNPAAEIAGYSFDAPTGAGVKAAFKRAGLGPREMVLLLGAIGSVTDAVGAVKDGGPGEDDDLEDLSWQNSIPNTFGKESDKLGRPLSNAFGPGFLQRVAAGGGKEGLGVVGKALLEDDEVKSFVRKYAGNSKAFEQDLSEAYTKMTLLGERYETRNAL